MSWSRDTAFAMPGRAHAYFLGFIHKREELERRQRDIKERLELAHWELSEVENCMIEIDKEIKQIEDEKNAQYGIYMMKQIETETNEQHGVTK